MVGHKSNENMVELFCSSYCVRSYTLLPIILLEPQGKKNSTSADSKDTPRLVVATSDVRCCICRKKLSKGCTLYKVKNPREAFCSASCVSKKHPHAKFDTKKCHNCSKVIERPQNIILSPVDDTGTMMELCSEACLSSIKSKRMAAAKPLQQQGGPSSLCKMCAKYCYCAFNMSLSGEVHSLCSESCLINYHKINKIPCSRCDICSTICPNKWLTVKLENGPVNICGDDCLFKFKEKVETPQLCSMCHTPHEMTDMVEKQSDKGKVDFFCSHRCVMVHQAKSLSASGNKSSVEDTDINVKPLLPGLGCLKEEPVDEEYAQSLGDPVSPQSIKDEPKAPKEELTIDSVFSLVEDSKPTEPDVRMSCSQCSMVLTDGDTVYQRKGHTEIFCSTPCLLKLYQMKSVKKTCHFCLQVITKPQAVLQAPVDDEGTKKDFCNKICLSSFNYKKIVSQKTSVTSVALHSQCSMCTRYCVSKHELILHDDIYKICSDPCFHRFCNMNELHICENCHSCCNSWLTLKTVDGDRTLCGAECLAQYKQKIETLQQCAMCCTSHLISNMVENRNGEDVIELFCTSSCMMASKIQAISASGASLNCDNCSKMTVPACHLAMPDASIRNFCTLTCAMAFKEIKKDLTTATNSTEAQNSSQIDLDKPLEKFLCAKCGQIIKSAPKIVQTKERLHFVCSLACSQEFKRVNNIKSACEYCKSERIIHEVKRIDNKDCYFCSDGCRMLFGKELEIRWGKHCHSCAFCLSVSKNVVTNQEKGLNEEFCSEVCSSNYKMLINHAAKCDACGRTGKLKQSLPLLGETKHFCSLKCLLHFCNQKLHKVDTAPRSADDLQSSPVITNVMSLSSTLAWHPPASEGCTQLEMAQPRISVLPVPVPVPVFVPVPMNMYSQYTPKPVALPIPLPVPVFLPEKPSGSEPAVGEKIPTKSTEADSRSETDDGNESEGRQEDGVMEEDETHKPQSALGEACLK
ncbi:zinc finger MYM-type protein 4-like [Xenentodon cancila]